MSFVIASCALPSFRLGETAEWDGKMLQIGNISFSSEQAQHFPGVLPVGKFHPLAEHASFPMPVSFFGGSAASHAEAHKIKLLLSEAIKKENWDNAAELACAMLGLGCGLTPSGDDWLTGLLAFLHFTALQECSSTLLCKLRERLPAHLQETNDISARFLELACAGRFSAPICALFSAWYRDDRQEFDHAVSRVLRLGHTSGMDTLGGIHFLYERLKHVRE